MSKILVINGVNLNMLGTREPSMYGLQSLSDIELNLAKYADKIGDTVVCKQSNCEGELVDFIHGAYDNFDGIILNAGAYTHYSIAIRDAISSVNLPVIEVHISNVYKREEFRHTSVLSAVCAGVIAGFGVDTYTLAMQAMHNILNKNEKN